MESEEVLNRRRTNAVRLALRLEGALNTKFTRLRTEVLDEAIESEASGGRVTRYFGVIKIVRPGGKAFLYSWFTNSFPERFHEIANQEGVADLFTDEAGASLPDGTTIEVYEIYDLDDDCKQVYPKD